MRIKELLDDEMTATQKNPDEIVAGPRGKLQGPLRVWLTSPNLADKAQKLVSFVDTRPRYQPILAN